jgi:NAD+ synthase
VNAEQLSENLVDWLRAEVKAAGCRGVVFGLSGGIDSATVAVLSRRAFRDEHLGVIMPADSDPRDREDALLVVEKFQLKHREVDLSPVFAAFLSTLGEPADPASQDLARNNIKPRLRMATLYFFAARHRYLVVGTGNRTELTLGYFTKYGDGGVDLLPLGHLVKHEVRELATHLSMPSSIIEKPPSAGMWQGQTDEGELGFSYDDLDRYLVGGEGSEALAKRVEELRQKNAHKLRIPKLPPSTAA